MENNQLLNDVEILRESITRDLNNESYIGYEDYLNEFNRILRSLQEEKICEDIEPIDLVPDNHKAYMGSGISQEEIAKFKEIAYKSEKLYSRISKFGKPKGLELDSDHIIVISQAANFITKHKPQLDWITISGMFGVSKIAASTYRLLRSQSFNDDDYSQRVQDFLDRVYFVDQNRFHRLISFIIAEEIKPSNSDFKLFPQLREYISDEKVLPNKEEQEVSHGKRHFGTGLFVSYCHEDKEFARKISRDLGELGADIWIDESEMMLGDSLIQKISEAIDSVDYVGVVLSPSSVFSEWVQKEVNIAMTKEINGKKVVVLPLLYKKCEIPLFLSDKFYADFVDSDHNTGKYEESLRLILDRLGITHKK